jgi:phosphatidylserine/phosphatidylglycerophosphate/cardiolipin synthase-like enzyme
MSLSNFQLHDEHTFYQKFLSDLEQCQKELIIESPYITCERMRTFDRIFEKLLKRKVKIYIITRDPNEHEDFMKNQAEAEITNFEVLGIQPLLCIGNHHRKLAILDRKVLWEGSLNILSQTFSREIMRRIDNRKLTLEMFNFLKLENFL